VSRRPRLADRRRAGKRTRGQGLVEFALFVPLFLLLLFTMLDFGFAMYTKLTVDYATREGARVGAALAAGGGAIPCAQVDNHVIAAVQRVLESAGISVPLNNSGNNTKSGVNWIRIYKATNNADGSGYLTANNYNEWTYSAGNGPTVDGSPLNFVAGTQSWSACAPRLNGVNPDKIGVAVDYSYAWTTPLLGALKLVVPSGSFFNNLRFVDKTVMNLNPTFP